MTTYSSALNRTAGLNFWFGSRGQGDDAARIHEALDVPREPGPSVLMGKRFWALQEAYEEAYEDNWDGYGAAPASTDALQQAYVFLRILPKTIPDPDIAIDPDGEVSLDWYYAPRVTFSVSISPTGRLSYAGLYGENTTYGTESITKGLPKTIMDNLGRLAQLAPKP